MSECTLPEAQHPLLHLHLLGPGKNKSQKRGQSVADMCKGSPMLSNPEATYAEVRV